MADSSFKHLTVIGTGLIGGSFVMACREIYPDLFIRAVDHDADTLQYALKSCLADQVSLTVPGEFEDDHLIVLATHLKSSLAILGQIALTVRDRNILVTDIGSCKRQICTLGEDLLPNQFIGGHPLAGKERSGIRHATSLLFAGKPYALCPPPNMAHDELLQQRHDQLKQFLEEGLRVEAGDIEWDAHDRYMAFVSHFPQLYSILLTNLLFRNEPGKLLTFHGAGIDDQLRLAASPYEFWRDVFELNRENLREVIHKFGDMLDEADTILDQPPMSMWFERANTMHQEFHQFRLH